MNFKGLSVTILVVGLSGVLTPARADRTWANLFPASYPAGEMTLQQKGISKLTVGYIFDVYVAAFYQPPGSGPADALADQPRHLEIHYLRAISREDFIDAAEDMLSRQHPPSEIAAIRDGIERINAWYEDVGKGDRYALTYVPGIGTELKRNGVSKGIVEGDTFARIYFSIWLGENNPYRAFRDRLVGLR